MKLKTFLLGSFLSLFSATTMAGGNHSHGPAKSPVTQEVAQTKSKKVIDSLIERKKIDSSWSSITKSTVKRGSYKGNPEWVVAYVNDKITDPDKKTLYIYLTISGDYLAVNYTGK